MLLCEEERVVEAGRSQLSSQEISGKKGMTCLKGIGRGGNKKNFDFFVLSNHPEVC